MQKQKRILFLYSRLPDYFYKCIQYFTSHYNCLAVVVRYEGDTNTKYDFEADEKVLLAYKNQTSIDELLDKYDTTAIVLSGWSDKEYLAIARKFVKKIPVILAMDNPWEGKIKQKILCKIAPFFIHKFCNKIWVTGISQFEYARRLRFDRKNIMNGLYSADTHKFYSVNDISIRNKQNYYPRVLAYVGRLVEYKQPEILANVFDELVKRYNLNWKLIIAGEGPMRDIIDRKKYSSVELRDFISPKDLPEFYSNIGAFCLPSKGEHWGVAVHEAVAAGLPVILSDSVESGTEFLINGYNGFSFRTGDVTSFAEQLLCLMQMENQELLQFSNNSIKLSERISHETWAAVLSSHIK